MKPVSKYFLIFLLVAAVQLGVPASMIVKRNNTLKNGEVYKFKTRPVDPYDAFRGRYVALGFEQGAVEWEKTTHFEQGEELYAILDIDSDGFDKIVDLKRERPENKSFLTVRVSYHSRDSVRLDLPFDRYYMNEKLAPRADRAYREFSRVGKQKAYVTVRILDGFAVLEELYIDDKPIHEYLKSIAP